MIDWREGGWTGSINRLVRNEVRVHRKKNSFLVRNRYKLHERLLRAFFSVETFFGFLALYLAATVTLAFIEIAAWSLCPSWIAAFWSAAPNPRLESVLLNLSGYLITAQVGVLGVITLALALVTLIAQGEHSATDVRVYYHESLAFGVVASCVALLAILCVQLVWPAEAAAMQAGLNVELSIYKAVSFAIHLSWLLVNFAGLALFISITFGFVQQAERERMRERYTANVLFPINMSRRLKAHFYAAASSELLPKGSRSTSTPEVTFGIDFGSPYDVELKAEFTPVASLHDVRMIWVRWVISRWSSRCRRVTEREAKESPAGLSSEDPAIWFTPVIDAPLQGSVAWCRRRGGVPLTRFERWVLRRAFRFRRYRAYA